jgi:ankyrin repeat protein
MYATRLFEIAEIKNRWLGSTVPLYALHQTSRIGLENTVYCLLELNIGIKEENTDSSYSIYYAAIKGHATIARLLLEYGANANAQRGLYGNALQAACSRSYLGIVKMLLDKRPDINAHDRYYGNALQAAQASSNETIMDLLAVKGAVPPS